MVPNRRTLTHYGSPCTITRVSEARLIETFLKNLLIGASKSTQGRFQKIDPDFSRLFIFYR